MEWIASLAQDIRYAGRSLRRSPSFTAIAVLTLGIGVGATTAIFSTVNATLLRPLPYPQAGELVDVRTRLLDGRVTTGLLSATEIAALNRQPTIVARAAGLSGLPFDATLLRADGTPVSVVLIAALEGFFDVLELPMARGRAFTREEHVATANNNNNGGGPLAAVVSYRAWGTLFGRNPDIVGTNVRIAEAPGPVTIVGVASPALDFPRGVDFWFNARTTPQDVAHVYGTIVRLRPGATLDQLRGAAAVAMADLARTVPSDVGREYVFRTLVSSLVGDLASTLLIVLAATSLLLLLACVNVTNLLLARGMARMREIAVRTALGAGRGRVVRQLLTEAMVLAAAGAIVGLLLALAAVRLLLTLGASKLPRLDAVPFDWRVLLFALGVLGFTGLTMGLAPAWRMARTDVRTLLNESGRSSTSSRAASRLMSGLIVAEIALAIVLVAGAGWLVQSFARLRATDPGFTASGRMVVDVRPTRNLGKPDDARAWSAAMLNHVREAAPGAVAGAATSFPFRVDRDSTLNIELQGEPPDTNHMRGARGRIVTPGYFEAMGVNVVTGRTFTDDDRKDTQLVTVVNRAFVRRFLSNRDPLTGAFAYGYPEIDRKTMSRVVGVVEDVRYKSLAEEAEPTYYLPETQVPFVLIRAAVVVATRNGNVDALVAPIRDALKRFDPQMVVAFTPAPQIVADTLSRQELGMALMLIFGATALALAAIGIYGLIAYAAVQRSGELATRIALGASSGQVFWLMMGAGQRLAAAGLLVGLAAAYIGGRIVANNVFAMRASDPAVLIAAGVIVAAVAGAATMIPAVRASRLNPTRALRSE